MLLHTRNSAVVKPSAVLFIVFILTFICVDHYSTSDFIYMNTWLFPYYLVGHYNTLMNLSFKTHESIL